MGTNDTKIMMSPVQFSFTTTSLFAHHILYPSYIIGACWRNLYKILLSPQPLLLLPRLVMVPACMHHKFSIEERQTKKQ